MDSVNNFTQPKPSMLKSPEPKTLFLKDYFDKRKTARRESVVRFRRLFFKLAQEFTKDIKTEKKALLDEYGFDEQYRHFIESQQWQIQAQTEMPYRSSLPPLPTYEQVSELLDIDQLREAGLFVDPKLHLKIDPRTGQWMPYISDALVRTEGSPSSNSSEESLERVAQRNKKIESVIQDLRDSLNAFLYIFH